MKGSRSTTIGHKMDRNCAKCKLTIKTKDFPKCSLCTHIYHTRCSTISKTFNIMDTEMKSKWKCQKCLKKKTNEEIRFFTPPTSINSPISSTPRDAHIEDNIIVNVSTENTFSALTDDEECDLQQQSQQENCILSQSCPEKTTCNSEEIQEMRETINELQSNLASAHCEIDNILSENYALKKQITDCEKRIQHLTLICKSVDKKHSFGSKSKSFNRTKLNYSLEGNTTEKPEQNNKSRKTFHEIFDQQKIITTDHTENHSQKLPQTKINKTNFTQGNQKGKSIIEGTTSSMAEKNHSGSSVSNIHEIVQSPPEGVSSIESNYKKRKVIILADEQGRGVQKILQGLLGAQYHVFCFWKSGAALPDLLSLCKSDLAELTLNDYVIFIGFKNDVSPFVIRYMFTSWLNSIQHTNVIVCETPYNKYLNESKLNHELKFLCSNFKNTVFLDLEYSRFQPMRKYFATLLCRNLLREILRLFYYDNYYQNQAFVTLSSTTYTQTETIIYNSQSTQTDSDMNTGNSNYAIATPPRSPINHSDKNNFFRI